MYVYFNFPEGLSQQKNYTCIHLSDNASKITKWFINLKLNVIWGNMPSWTNLLDLDTLKSSGPNRHLHIYKHYFDAQNWETRINLAFVIVTELYTCT